MYREVLGSGMTLQMQRCVLPALVWNQDVYGQRIFRRLESAQQWFRRNNKGRHSAAFFFPQETAS
jgi:hypothetical protein